MLTLKFCASGKAITEFNYEKWMEEAVKRALSPNKYTMRISNYAGLTLIQTEIAKGNIPCENVLFSYTSSEGEETLKHNEYGELERFIRRSFLLDISKELVKARMDKRARGG